MEPIFFTNVKCGICFTQLGFLCKKGRSFQYIETVLSLPSLHHTPHTQGLWLKGIFLSHFTMFHVMKTYTNE